MTNKLSKFLALTVVVGAFVFAGCGSSGDDGPSAADAQKQYAQTDKQLNDIGTELGAAIGSASSKTDAELEAQFTTFADKAKGELDDLKAIEVPDDVTSAKDDLVKSIEDGINDVQQISSAAGQHDAAAAGTATRQLITDSKDIESAQKAFKAALKKAVDN